jgi:hypothetical protein
LNTMLLVFFFLEWHPYQGKMCGERAVLFYSFVICRLPRMNLATRHFSPDHPFKHSLWSFFFVNTTIMWKSARALLCPLVFVYVHVDDSESILIFDDADDSFVQ